jgi:hypothetical protein
MPGFLTKCAADFLLGCLDTPIIRPLSFYEDLFILFHWNASCDRGRQRIGLRSSDDFVALEKTPAGMSVDGAQNYLAFTASTAVPTPSPGLA